MCGRYTLQAPTDRIAEMFGLVSFPELASRYNIAPTQNAPVIRRSSDDDSREVTSMRWGLVPFFAKDLSMGARMINARSETVDTKPAYRDAFRRRRCLVPADGFIEWETIGKVKQPFHITRPDGAPFVMAGLWETWRGEGDRPVLSYTILTTEANERVAPIHDRMPVILTPEDCDLWLDPGIESRELLEPLLAPCDDDALRLRPVNRRINNARNDDAACLEAPDEPGLFD